MDSRLRKALETEAAVNTAKALLDMAPRLEAIETRLARIEALLTSPAPERDPSRNKGR